MSSAERSLISHLIPVLFWAVAASIAWYFGGASYERFLAALTSSHLPQGVYLRVGEHMFAIGILGAAGPERPGFSIISHNFGFGLVVTTAVILGTRGHLWRVRLLGLGATWILLALMQVWVLVTVAHVYVEVAGQPTVSWGSRMFIKAIHPVVAVAPAAIVVVWILAPMWVTKGLHRAARRRGRHSQPRRA